MPFNRRLAFVFARATATSLNKYQWDLIHYPNRDWFSWLESEEEGAIISFCKKLNDQQKQLVISSIQRLLDNSFIFSHIYKISIDNYFSKEDYEISLYDGPSENVDGEASFLPCSMNIKCKKGAKYKGYILLNPQIFSTEAKLDASLYEEVFHCGQALYYGTIINDIGTYNINQNQLLFETEVKIAKAYSGFIFEEYLVNWSKDSKVSEYFSALHNNKPINTKLEEDFRYKIDNLAKQVYFIYKMPNESYDPGSQLDNDRINSDEEYINWKKQNFETPYFNIFKNLYLK
jgi:hypothetical protein